MKKSKRILFVSLGIMSTLAASLPLIATSCKGSKNPDKPTPQPKPDPKPHVETEQEKLDKWVKENMTDVFSIINGKDSEFQQAIAENKDFYYSYKNKQILAVDHGKRPNWKTDNNYLLELKNVNFPSNDYQLVNANKPTYESNGQTRLSSHLEWEIINEEIVFKYKVAIYKKDGNHIISNEVISSNLGKFTGALSEEDKKLLEAQSKTSFDYPNKENTLLADAKEDQIIKNIPEGYELTKFTAVKNSDLATGIYEYTIIFKLKSIANPDVVSKKNVEYVIRGFKKTQEIIEQEKKAIEKISEEFKKTTIKLLNEKAYQDVIKNKQIDNYDKKPNFVVSGYDENLYNATLSNLEVKENGLKYDIKLTLTLTSKTNSDIFAKSEMNVSAEYVKGINPHTLNDQEQKQHLENALLDTVIYPYFSKDKTYIQKMKYSELTNRSYFISRKDNDLNYQFTELIKRGDKYFVKTEVSFDGWLESPKVVKEIEVSFDKLGLDIINDARIKKGQEPIQDQTAPSPTLPEYEPNISIDKFKDTEQDEVNKNIINNKFLQGIKKAKVWAYNAELLEKIEKNEANAYIQNFNPIMDGINSRPKTEMYFGSSSKYIYEQQQVYYFSNFRKEENGEYTVKVTTVSIQDFNSGEFSNACSTRVTVDTSKVAEDYINKKCFTEYVKSLALNITYKNAFETLVKDAKIENLECNNLPSGYTIEYEIDKTQKKANSGILKIWYSISKEGHKTFKISLEILGFNRN